LESTSPTPQSVQWATNVEPGPANESSQSVSFTLSGDTNPSLFSVAPTISPTGVLTYTATATDYGSASITVTLMDNGGTANGGQDTSAPATLVINVTPVNQPPSFTGGPNQTATIDDGTVPVSYSVPNWATNIEPGPANESGQSVSFTVTNSDPSLFASTGQPTVTVNGSAPNYPLTGTLSYQTAPFANGSASITVTLVDNGGTTNGGQNTSMPYTFVINVTPVNQQPSFTGGPNQAASIDDGNNPVSYSVPNWATNIEPGPASESGQSVSFTVTDNNPGLFTSTGQPAVTVNGSAPNYPLTGTLSYQTAPFANGSATVTVTLMDNGGTANGGQDASTPYTFIINVTPVNQQPSFTPSGPVTVLESASPTQQTVQWATNVEPGPASESGQSVSFTLSGDTNPSLFSVAPSISPTGVLTFTPTAQDYGSATITVTLMDNGGTANGGQNTSTAATLVINETFVNQPPTFTAGGPVTTLESTSPTPQSVQWATNVEPGPANESNQSVSFTLSGDTNPSLFSVAPTISPTGVLTYTATATDYGSASITVTLMDNGGTANGGHNMSTSATLVINVTPVNQPPSFTPGNPVTILESASPSPQSVQWATNVEPGPANESNQSVSFTLSGDTNPSLFSVAPSISPTGVLTFTPTAQDSGSASITVTLMDNGGTANGGQNTSAPATLVINVTPINQPPTFTPPASLSTTVDSGSVPITYSIPNWATNISSGPANQPPEAVNFIVDNNNSFLFTVQPTISPDGTLSFQTAAMANGSATLTVRLHNSGGTANGGQDTSAPVTYVINVTPTTQFPTVSFAELDNQTFKTSGQTTVVVQLSQAVSMPVSVNYATSDGPAKAGTDYLPASGTLNFPVGATTASFTVQILNDGVQTGNLRVQLALSDPINISLGLQSQAVVTIQDIYPTDNDDFISGLYHDLLGRAADQGGVNFYLTPLQSAETPLLPGVMANFVNSLGYYEELVGNTTNGFYAKFLDEQLQPGDPNVTYWANQMVGGETDEQVIAQFVSVPSYYTGKGQNSTLGWLQAVYQDLLGRPLDAGGEAFFLPQLGGSGGSYNAAALQNVALQIMDSSEYRLNLIDSYFQTYLNRPAGATDRQYWLSQFQAGDTDEQEIEGIGGSLEGLLNNGGTNAKWVTTLYQKTLGRSPSATELSAQLNSLENDANTMFDNGYQLQRFYTAQAILNSSEFASSGTFSLAASLNTVISEVFNLGLGRSASASDIAYWSNQFVGDANQNRDVAAAILSTGEFFNDAHPYP
jgi:Calx-beta domain/Bacterial Ig domain